MTVQRRWTGTEWEIINAATVDRVVSNLISEQILTSDSSTVTFSGLDSTADGDYTLEYTCLPGNTNNVSPLCYINNDSTASRYINRILSSGTSSPTTSLGNTDGINMGFLASSSGMSGIAGTLEIRRLSGLTMFKVHHASLTNVTALAEVYGGTYNQNTTITSLVLSAITGEFATGSTFRLYGSNVNKQIAVLNLDGGTPDSIYLSSQVYDGGTP